jgi:hypothetical protein
MKFNLSAFVGRSFIVLIALSASMAFAQKSVTKQLGKTLTLIQTVTGVDTPASTFIATVGTLDFSPVSGVRAELMGGSVANASAVASANPSTYGNGTRTPGQIRDFAKGIMLGQANTIIGNMRSYMAANSIGSGFFVFEQEVQAAGQATTQKLVWQIVITENGRTLYGDPKVINADPVVVYMRYTSKALEAGLPTSWAFTEAGKLEWQLRRRDGTPVNAFTTIDTNGAFDEPVDDPVNPVNENQGVECLADKTKTGCPTGYPDAKSLIDQYGALGAIIDYVRKVQPVYDEYPDPAAAGEFIYKPRMSVSYDLRELVAASCTSKTYRNKGRYGYTLATILDRYLLEEGESTPYQINRYTNSTISPTENFDITKPTNQLSTSLNGQVYNFLEAPNNLMPTSDVPGLIYTAPITLNIPSGGGVSFGDMVKYHYADWPSVGGGIVNFGNMGGYMAYQGRSTYFAGEAGNWDVYNLGIGNYGHGGDWLSIILADMYLSADVQKIGFGNLYYGGAVATSLNGQWVWDGPTQQTCFIWNHTDSGIECQVSMFTDVHTGQQQVYPGYRGTFDGKSFGSIDRRINTTAGHWQLRLENQPYKLGRHYDIQIGFKNCDY